jgi:hypothetical protein
VPTVVLVVLSVFDQGKYFLLGQWIGGLFRSDEIGLFCKITVTIAGFVVWMSKKNVQSRSFKTILPTTGLSQISSKSKLNQRYNYRVLRAFLIEEQKIVKRVLKAQQAEVKASSASKKTTKSKKK